MNFLAFGANFISRWIRIQKTNRIRIRYTDPNIFLSVLFTFSLSDVMLRWKNLGTINACVFLKCWSFRESQRSSISLCLAHVNHIFCIKNAFSYDRWWRWCGPWTGWRTTSPRHLHSSHSLGRIAPSSLSRRWVWFLLICILNVLRVHLWHTKYFCKPVFWKIYWVDLHSKIWGLLTSIS